MASAVLHDHDGRIGTGSEQQAAEVREGQAKRQHQDAVSYPHLEPAVAIRPPAPSLRETQGTVDRCRMKHDQEYAIS